MKRVVRSLLTVLLALLWLGLGSPVQAKEFVHSEQELIAYAKTHGPTLDSQSKAFVDMAVREISQQWQLESLKKYAHPKLIAAKPEETWQKMFTMFTKKLGPLKGYQGSSGEAKILVNEKGQLGFTAQYQSAITCEQGPAKVQIKLVRFDTTWYVTQFVVYSDAFLSSN